MTGEQHAEEQLAAQVQALSEEVAHRVDGSMQFVEGRVGVPAAARVLAAHLDLLQVRSSPCVRSSSCVRSSPHVFLKGEVQPMLDG